MAPEALGKKEYSKKTDVWAFANTVIEVLTGKDPFPGKDLLTIAMEVRDKNLHPNVPEECPDWLNNRLESCWSPNPEDRPPMDEVVSTIQNKF
jgi:serine/threonine protein kinase